MEDDNFWDSFNFIAHFPSIISVFHSFPGRVRLRQTTSFINHRSTNCRVRASRPQRLGGSLCFICVIDESYLLVNSRQDHLIQ